LNVIQQKKITMKKIFIFSALLLAISISFTSCFKEIWCVTGEGDIVTVELDLDDFNAIEAAGAFDIYISQGETQFVEARGHENIIERLKTYVSGDTWKAELENEICYTDYELALYIQVPNIDEIRISGSSDVTVEDFVGQESLELVISGSGDVELNEFLDCKRFDIRISGSGDIDCRGEFDQLEELEIDITGSGNFKGYNARTDHCDINISGSGDCKVYVNERLDIRISGSGDIHYKGNPIITTDITGSGDIFDEN
jgi:hypothetical protein